MGEGTVMAQREPQYAQATSFDTVRRVTVTGSAVVGTFHADGLYMHLRSRPVKAS